MTMQTVHGASRIGRRRVLVSLILSAVLGWSANPVDAEDWPEWRGANRLGIWHETGIIDRDDDHRRLQAKIGELLMETELLYAKVDQLEAGGPLARRRSTR